MQNATNENFLVVRAIEDNMLPMFNAPIASPNLIAGAAEFRSFHKVFEAFNEAVKISIGLLQVSTE